MGSPIGEGSSGVVFEAGQVLARLEAWVRDTLPSLERRLLLFQQVCSAVATAHRNQVIHRDLKPGNILVTIDGQPKLVDFGIARVLPGEDEEISRLTLAYQQPMTPQYASPEQLRDSDVTPASDVYSWGSSCTSCSPAVFRTS